MHCGPSNLQKAVYPSKPFHSWKFCLYLHPPEAWDLVEIFSVFFWRKEIFVSELMFSRHTILWYPNLIYTGNYKFDLAHSGYLSCGIPDGETYVLTGGGEHNFVTRSQNGVESSTSCEVFGGFSWMSVCRYNVKGFVEELPTLPKARKAHACTSLPNQVTKRFHRCIISRLHLSRSSSCFLGLCRGWWNVRFFRICRVVYVLRGH